MDYCNLENDFEITMGERISEKGDVPDCVKSPPQTSAGCEIRHGPWDNR